MVCMVIHAPVENQIWRYFIFSEAKLTMQTIQSLTWSGRGWARHSPILRIHLRKEPSRNDRHNRSNAIFTKIISINLKTV